MPVTRHDTDRLCLDCGTRLNSYNAHETCALHSVEIWERQLVVALFRAEDLDAEMRDLPTPSNERWAA